MGDKWRVDGVTRGPLLECGCDGGASGDQRWVVLCPLHAAAPDLLAALETAFPTDTAGAMFVDDEVVGRARAAIDKAKGSENAAP